MPSKFVKETMDRMNQLMERNMTAKTYLDLSHEDNQESMELVSRIEEMADAMTMCRSRRNLPDEERELYAFADTITEAEIVLCKRYFVWFRSLSAKDIEQVRPILRGSDEGGSPTQSRLGGICEAITFDEGDIQS